VHNISSAVGDDSAEQREKELNKMLERAAAPANKASEQTVTRAIERARLEFQCDEGRQGA
jgi:hypothetical protein